MKAIKTTIQDAAETVGLIGWLLIVDLAIRLGVKVGLEEVEAAQKRLATLTGSK